MKKNNLASFVCLSLITVTCNLTLEVKKAQAIEDTIALCQGTRNTVRIYKEGEKMRMRVFNQRDQIVWLRTGSKEEAGTNGLNYLNITGDQKIKLFVANSNNICLISIGERPAEKGRLLIRGSLVSDNKPSSTSNTVTGTITYLPKIALPAGAVIEVKLLDVSLQDFPGKVISEKTITTTGEQVPIPFELTFNPAMIQSNHTIAVAAQIKVNDQLAFTTTQRYAVITNGAPLKAELILQQVKNQSPKNPMLEGKWLLEDLNGAGVLDNLQTTLNFDSQGRLSGFGGCNNYFASYTLGGDQLKVGQIGSTFKACSPAVMDQESKYFKALQQAYRIRLEGAFLYIDTQGDDKPLRFTLL